MANLKTKFDNLKTKQKLTFGLSVPIIILIILGSLSLSNLQSISKTANWVDHTRIVLAQAAGIIGSAVNMETGMRGFLLAGKEEFLEPYRLGERSTYTELEELQSIVSDNPKQVNRLREAEKVLREWQSKVTEPAIALRKTVGDTKTMDDIAKLVGEAQGKVYFDQFRAIMADFSDEERTLMATRQQTNIETLGSANVITIMSIIFGLTAGLLLIWLIGNAIAKPVSHMAMAMRNLADGDLESDVPAVGRKDEIGDMADAVQVFKSNAIQVKLLAADQQEQDQRNQLEKKAMMEQMATDFDHSIGGVMNAISSTVAQVHSLAQSMSVNADQTHSRSEAVLEASGTVSTNVSSVASAAEELTASINMISVQMDQSTTISKQAVQDADATNLKIQALNHSANKIGEVVSLISDIAEQTNLLALNASIEAARAGDAGRGFSVVASEVKELAGQTANATEGISEQVKSIQKATMESVNDIQAVTSIINEINGITTNTASAVDEQDGATQEIARTVSNVAHSTDDVAENMLEVSQAASETGQAASEVLSAIDGLTQELGSLDQEVKNFLAHIRSYG